MTAWLYILRLKSVQLYIGSTTDLKQRCQDHQNCKACQTTKLDPPVELVYSESYPNFSEARKREAQIKRWTRAKKEALVISRIKKFQHLVYSNTESPVLSMEIPRTIPLHRPPRLNPGRANHRISDVSPIVRGTEPPPRISHHFASQVSDATQQST